MAISAQSCGTAPTVTQERLLKQILVPKSMGILLTILLQLFSMLLRGCRVEVGVAQKNPKGHVTSGQKLHQEPCIHRMNVSYYIILQKMHNEDERK